MSVKELEKEVRALPARQLKRFGRWFDGYRQQIQSAPEVADDWDDDLADAQTQEILRRRTSYLADTSIATPWEGTAERLIKQVRARRRQKTS
jgi:hypothetical protein